MIAHLFLRGIVLYFWNKPQSQIVFETQKFFSVQWQIFVFEEFIESAAEII
jgi:hypothetical protein